MTVQAESETNEGTAKSEAAAKAEEEKSAPSGPSSTAGAFSRTAAAMAVVVLVGAVCLANAGPESPLQLCTRAAAHAHAQPPAWVAAEAMYRRSVLLAGGDGGGAALEPCAKGWVVALRALDRMEEADVRAQLFARLRTKRAKSGAVPPAAAGEALPPLAGAPVGASENFGMLLRLLGRDVQHTQWQNGEGLDPAKETRKQRALVARWGAGGKKSFADLLDATNAHNMTAPLSDGMRLARAQLAKLPVSNALSSTIVIETRLGHGASEQCDFSVMGTVAAGSLHAMAASLGGGGGGGEEKNGEEERGGGGAMAHLRDLPGWRLIRAWSHAQVAVGAGIAFCTRGAGGNSSGGNRSDVGSQPCVNVVHHVITDFWLEFDGVEGRGGASAAPIPSIFVGMSAAAKQLLSKKGISQVKGRFGSDAEVRAELAVSVRRLFTPLMAPLGSQEGAQAAMSRCIVSFCAQLPKAMVVYQFGFWLARAASDMAKVRLVLVGIPASREEEAAEEEEEGEEEEEEEKALGQPEKALLRDEPPPPAAGIIEDEWEKALLRDEPQFVAPLLGFLGDVGVDLGGFTGAEQDALCEVAFAARKANLTLNIALDLTPQGGDETQLHRFGPRVGFELMSEDDGVPAEAKRQLDRLLYFLAARGYLDPQRAHLPAGALSEMLGGGGEPQPTPAALLGEAADFVRRAFAAAEQHSGASASGRSFADFPAKDGWRSDCSVSHMKVSFVPGRPVEVKWYSASATEEEEEEEEAEEEDATLSEYDRVFMKLIAQHNSKGEDAAPTYK
jgi:hypothetical protein